MRRQSKKSSNVVKVLSTTALVAALTAGTIPVYGADVISLSTDPTFPRIEVSDLADNPEYRQLIIDAFLARQSVMLHEAGEGKGHGTEISAGKTLADWSADEVADHDTDRIAVLPYVEDEAI
ncbi:MAG: hypothetical protein FWE90_03770 [Defluviitaleaceae bacterium]|nr:hypothetical protein [Defluviitaleaceae bacterium]